MQGNPLPPSVVLEHPVDGYAVYKVQHATCSARVAAHGAHVMEWQPAGCSQPVLYLSPQHILRLGKAIRGGIPVCWPWFNAHPTDASLPSHGIGRNRFWLLSSVAETSEGVHMRFTLSSSAETNALWPHPFQANLDIQLGSSLHVSLSTINKGEQPVAVGGALHTYLSVGAIGKVRVEGLDGTHYLDSLQNRIRLPQKGNVIFDKEVDRVYEHDSSQTAVLVDEEWGRTITVSKQGCAHLVVWNPWIEKAAKMGDLPDDAYKSFVCLEAANAVGPLPSAPPGGQAVVMSTTITVQQQEDSKL